MMRYILSTLILFKALTFADMDQAKEYVQGLPLFYYQFSNFSNFGDYLSLKLIERIVGGNVRTCKQYNKKQKLLAIGSILICANNDDVIWGTGMNGKNMNLNKYRFNRLDVRAVRGPLTRHFLISNFNINCPEIYGDPALLFPYFFPEFKKRKNPKYDYIIIPHYSEINLYPKSKFPMTVYPSEPWQKVIRKILNSKFVISGSLHGIILAEAYGIPARYLRTLEEEPLFKYYDYYGGTNRPSFQYAKSLEEALIMGGEPPFNCNLKKLYYSFPFEYWPYANYKHPNFGESK